MIKLSKKEAFTLVETFVFVTMLSLILAASVPLIARKHKHTPKVISHGSVVCYKNSSNQYVTDTYNSRYLIDRKVGGSSCAFNPSKNVPVYKVSMIPPGGGGVKYFANNTIYRGSTTFEQSRTFTTGSGYSTSWGSNKTVNALDDGKTPKSLNMHDDDLANAFNGKLYSRCITSTHKSGDSGKVCATWPDRSASPGIQEYLMKDGDNYWENKNCKGGSHAALTAACGVAGVATGGIGLLVCAAIGLITGAQVTELCNEAYTYDDSPKYPDVPVENYPLSSTNGCKGKGSGTYNNKFCVQADISRGSGNADYYGWQSYRTKKSSSGSYESFLTALSGKFTKKTGSDGSTGSNLGSLSTIWAALYGQRAGQGGKNNASTIKDNWQNITYKNAVYSGGISCSVGAYGTCTGEASGALHTAASYQGSSKNGYFNLSSERTPALTQTVKVTRNFAFVGAKGAVAAPLSFETFEMANSDNCTMQIHDIIPAQDRVSTSTSSRIPRAGNGAKLVCKKGTRTVLEKAVGLPDKIGGTSQREQLFRGSWSEMGPITANSYIYNSEEEYAHTGEINDQSSLEGAIDQIKGAGDLWSRKDKGKFSSGTPFDSFGKAGLGQQITETCHPEIISKWNGSSTALANTGERKVHGTKSACGESSDWVISRQAQAGGSGAVIISW